MAQFVATVTVEDGRFVARCSCGWQSGVAPWSRHSDDALVQIATYYFAAAIKHQASEHGFALPKEA